ncbi:type II and III secretion system protein family protein [Fontimonas sp. SYSU GA230001]|uniref:type II and III secretion system protein family protein n=1 Tax=Fontimonas sp. SYSU GA230001 TaxID=3142450 RepID=UPI0032B61FD8
MKTKVSRSLLIALCASLGALAPQFTTAQAAAPDVRAVTTGQPGPFAVRLYKSVVLSFPRSVKQVSVGNPGVADILILRGQQLYVVGKNLGTTNVVAWDADGNIISSFDVEVTHDLDTLKEKLHALLPGEPIKVHSAQEKVILSGQVSSLARMNAAKELAESFLPDCIRAVSDAPEAQGKRSSAGTGTDPSCKKGAVVNLMQVGGAQQVMLKVTVAEMARSVIKRLDANLNVLDFGRHVSGGAVSGGATFPDALDPDGLRVPLLGELSNQSNIIGPALKEFAPTTPVIDSTGLFLSYLSGETYLQAVLDISKQNGLAKILSEPTLTTLTGQEAQFLSGGEFPIPVPQGGNSSSTTIEFKEFGVGLRFVPIVLDSGRINLTLNVSVSEISGDNNVVLRSTNTASTFFIPSLTKRSASGTVELADGQSMGVAGLINDNLRSFVNRLPGLGDLPIIGALFRSQQYVSGQTELVIFVTPYLAKPIAPDQIALPTDSFVPPGDLEFYLLGRTDSLRSAPLRKKPAQLNVGHDLNP